MGADTLTSNTTGYSNTAIGNGALSATTTMGFSTAVGQNALHTFVGTSNASTAVGAGALYNNTTGDRNTGIGTFALISDTTGGYNTGLGHRAMEFLTTGSNNNSVGYSSLDGVTTGSDNVGLGMLAGANLTTGNSNIAIGNNTNFASPTANNQMNIGNIIFGTGMSGSAASPAGYVGIGTTAPSSALEVQSSNAANSGNTIASFRNSAGALRLSINDENGTGSKPSGILSNTLYGLGLYSSGGGGSSGIKFYTSGLYTERMRITDGGSVGIGTTSPAYKFVVESSDATAYAASGAPALPINATSAVINVRNSNTTSGSGSFIAFSGFENDASAPTSAYIGMIPNYGSYSPSLVFGHQTGAAAHTERLRIDYNGNVGIGTTSPEATLSVVGPIKIAGSGAETCDATHYIGGVRYNGGNIEFCDSVSWKALGVAGAGISSLTGDVTATGPGAAASTIVSVGGSTAAAVGTATVLANAATALNTASTIVKRDGSGNFAANVVTGNGLTLNNGGSLLNIVNPIGGAWTMTLPATAGSGGQVMQTNGAGLMSWVTAVTSANGFLNGGNSFGAASSLGNIDNNDLKLITNNTPRMTVTANGNVGIGTTAPTGIFEVQGGTSAASTNGKAINLVAQNSVTGGFRGGNINLTAGTGSWWGERGDFVVDSNNNMIGNTASATGGAATAIGPTANAAGQASVALGWYASTPSVGAIAAGTWSTAAGNYSTAFGLGSRSPSTGQSTVGACNSVAGTEDAGTWVGTDPTFVVGNGSFSGNTCSTYLNAMTILKNGKVGIGTTTPSSKLEVAGVINTTPTAVSAAATSLDLATSNTFTIATAAGSAFTLSNMVDGAVYTIAMTDTTSRTYTFACSGATKYKPANAPTVTGTTTLYTVMTLKNGANYDCYVTWATGYQ